MQMSIIDTPGFGDKLDNTDRWKLCPSLLFFFFLAPHFLTGSGQPCSCKLILDYVEEQFKSFLKEETKIQRNPKFLDPRVHAVLYFLDPTGHK